MPARHLAARRLEGEQVYRPLLGVASWLNDAAERPSGAHQFKLR